MTLKMTGSCIYCYGNVYYHSTDRLIKCPWCGQTLVVAKFENELARMIRTEEENEEIKKKLSQAEEEKKAADDRLFSALTELGEIRDDQDALGKMLRLLSSGQGEAMQRLEFLQDISGRLIETKDDLFARLGVIQEIAGQLQKIDVDARQRDSVMNEFLAWSQQIQEADVKRLQGIGEQAEALLAGQKEIREKVDALANAADLHQRSLEEFHSQYNRDKLEELQGLYRQAANFQKDRRFDKAEEYYRRALTKGGTDTEILWRLLMCHYCLTYQKDEAGRMVPIILNPDLTDPGDMSLRRELEQHLAEDDKKYYHGELSKIDRILDKYRQLKGQVEYDVFLSVKQDDDGHYTADSDVASDLYDFLTGQGLRVFNSRRTPIPAGREYEPYIISALMSARVLIVVGTTPDNMTAAWVKNEWSRFQWLQFREKEKTGKTDRVLFCYLAKGMQAGQIPRALSPDRQAVHDGVKAHDELMAALSFLHQGKSSPSPHTEGSSSAVHLANFAQVEKQMKFWLLKGQYSKVIEKYNILTDEGLYLGYSSMHISALCARQKVSDIQKIVCSDLSLDQEEEFILAAALCDSEEEKKKLDELVEQNREWRGMQKEKKENDIPRPQKDKATLDEWITFGNLSFADLDYEEAVKWYRRAAEYEDARGQKLLADCFAHGEGVEEDQKQASLWYERAAEQGDMDAQYFIGVRYAIGKGVEKNQEKAVYWIEMAAKQGNEHAQDTLARYYENGNGVDKDPQQAFYWYQKAAEQGYKYAQYRLALCYVDGKGTIKDLQQALQWYLKAAEQGHDGAQHNLGECFEKGAGTGKNLQQAIYWYRKAAEQGFARSQTSLGWCYQWGIGVERDLEQAVFWYRKAAEQGNGNAQYNLGFCYQMGIGIEKDPGQAVSWYQKGAEQGNADAQNGLGWCYQQGIGIEKDQKQAAYWYQKAAEQGNANAQYNLGVFFAFGLGVEKNIDKAFSWYQKAALQEHAQAQYELGLCYSYGQGIETDLERAFFWYQKAAEQGLKQAQKKLEFCYGLGLGVKQSMSKSWYWQRRYSRSSESINDKLNDERGKSG